MQDKIDRRNYDVVSLSQGADKKRANFVQDARFIDKDKISLPGGFIKVFADIILAKRTGGKGYF